MFITIKRYLMHKRPNLKEALQVLVKYSVLNKDAAEALELYEILLKQKQEFLAARLVVEIVDLFYHKTETLNGQT
jgi:hypothetical protein